MNWKVVVAALTIATALTSWYVSANWPTVPPIVVSPVTERTEAPVELPPEIEIVLDPEPAPTPLPDAYLQPDRFSIVIKLTLVHEGGKRYTNHPNDPGGPTKYGITIHDVRKYLKKGATAADVQALTEKQAIVIYKRHYWDAIDADQLPVGLDYTVFDYTVNAGQGRSIPALKRCFAKHGGDKAVPLIICVNDDRMAFQMGLGPKYDVFKRGWRNRIESVTRISLNMAAPSLYKAGPPVDMIPRVGTGKAYEERE